MELNTYDVLGEAAMQALVAAEATIEGLAVMLGAFGLVVLILFAVETIKESRTK